MTTLETEEEGVSSTTEVTEHDRDERTRLASIIDSRREEIEQRWLALIPASVKGRPLDSSQLRDSMPEYLVRLADGLRGSESVEAGGSSSWENVAKEHAETRVRLGFDIDQLIEEFIILRRVLFDVIEEAHGSSFSVRDAATIADLIDGAIEAAVTSYVHSRDSELRRQQAEHLGFLTHELRNPLNTAHPPEAPSVNHQPHVSGTSAAALVWTPLLSFAAVFGSSTLLSAWSDLFCSIRPTSIPN